MASRGSLGAGVRVLLIDDSDLTLDFQTMLLERYGFEVHCCGALSEIDALEEGWRPTIVVTDVDLPEACDRDVIAVLSEHATTAGAPVVLCSGLSLEDLDRLRVEKQVAGCVSKSENIRDLPQLLNRLAHHETNNPTE